MVSIVIYFEPSGCSYRGNLSRVPCLNEYVEVLRKDYKVVKVCHVFDDEDVSAYVYVEKVQ